MTNNDLNQIRGVVKEELEPVTQKLDVLWDQVVKVTEDIGEVKETLDSHTAVLKGIEVKTEKNSEDIEKVDKRLTETESHVGIVPPSELTIVR